MIILKNVRQKEWFLKKNIKNKRSKHMLIKIKSPKDKPYDIWRCDDCGTMIPVTKGLPAPTCNYCSRVKAKILKKSQQLNTVK
jgi:RNA polymerase-binding transcription factor DksA